MDIEQLRSAWKQGEAIAQIHGWDFSIPVKDTGCCEKTACS